ncbi:MAG: lysophospholipase [Clostridium sp.]|nr:lysophospholipase [Clostridium sp.]
MKIESYHFPSATGVCEINGNIYTPDHQVEGVLVIHHGMAEHQERYLEFIEYLTSNGIAVFMHDMANHGKSNQDKALTGYFGEKNGYTALVADLKTTFDKAKLAYPDKKIVVMGHSMGSFIVRCFTAWYNDAGFAAAIYMGTGGSNPAAAVGDKLSALVAKIKGSTYKSSLLDKMTFGSYGSRFEKRTNVDWLTRDTKIVDKYISDEYCGFLFSAQGMNDLVKLNIAANSGDWYANVPQDLKILLISGDMDPVGNYAKGIYEIYDKLNDSGHTDVTLKLYKNGRHEILNELNKTEVYAYIKDFIISVL